MDAKYCAIFEDHVELSLARKRTKGAVAPSVYDSTKLQALFYLPSKVHFNLYKKISDGASSLVKF